MVAIVLSLLFGFIALAALAAVRTSIEAGIRSGRRILAELEDRPAEATVTRRQALQTGQRATA